MIITHGCDNYTQLAWTLNRLYQLVITITHRILATNLTAKPQIYKGKLCCQLATLKGYDRAQSENRGFFVALKQTKPDEQNYYWGKTRGHGHSLISYASTMVVIQFHGKTVEIIFANVWDGQLKYIFREAPNKKESEIVEYWTGCWRNRSLVISRGKAQHEDKDTSLPGASFVGHSLLRM